MKPSRKVFNLFFAFALLFGNSIVSANTLTGTVDTIQSYLPGHTVYVQLTSLPIFDGGSCTNKWATGDMDDTRFMTFIWPLLMNAKSQGKSVTIGVSSCVNSHPVIDWAQINPT